MGFVPELEIPHLNAKVFSWASLSAESWSAIHCCCEIWTLD